MSWIDNNTIMLNGSPYKVKYFSRDEQNDLGKNCWGDPNKINPKLIYLLDQFREYLGKPVRINYGTQGKHSKNSQHYLGNAVDCYVPGLDCQTQLLIAVRFGFTGIGVYPFWHNQGLHLDVRDLDLDKDFKAIWWRDKKGDYRKIENFKLG